MTNLNHFPVLKDLFIPLKLVNVKIRYFVFNCCSLERFVSAYPNQSKPNIMNLLNLSQSKQSIFSNLSSSTEPLSLQSLAESLQERFDSEAIECANVLKKRRRRMRGHKHKKRLKERRHKANK